MLQAEIATDQIEPFEESWVYLWHNLLFLHAGKTMQRLKYAFGILLLTNPLFADSIEAKFSAIKHDPNALYAFFKKMPKGGELHYHLSGSAYPENMLAVAAKSNYCLNETTLGMTKSETCNYIKASELSNYPTVYDQTVRAWSMKNFIAGAETGHDHFFATFYKFGEVVADNHVPLLAEVMTRAANQNEHYMEIMIMPDKARSAHFPNPAVIPMDYDKLRQKYLADPAFVAEINNTVEFTNRLLGDTRKFLGCDQTPELPVCQLTVRFQYHVLRGQTLEKVFPQALHAFETASRSPAIVGVNLVQAEDGIISLQDYHQQMRIFEYLHKLYPNVHIALHAGELAPQDVMPADLRFHIDDAINVGHAQRIGHGIDIAYEDNAQTILQTMRDKQIAVEINLSSNEAILGIKGIQHPLPYYLKNEVPVVLSTDDEGILRTDLTQQYVKAVMEYNLDYPTIKQINRNALTYSFLPGQNLWANAAKAELVQDCMDLQSASCLNFVAGSEKARLQRQLELELLEFESI